MITKEITSQKYIRLSKKERLTFGGRVIVARFGGGNDLMFFSEKEWEKWSENKLSELTGVKLRRRRRFIYSSAFEQNIDKQGIVNIPNKLRKEKRRCSRYGFVGMVRSFQSITWRISKRWLKRSLKRLKLRKTPEKKRGQKSF